MLIDFRQLFPKYGINPKGIIQVGAHWAEEHDVYVEMGIDRFVYVEPCKEAFDIMITKLGFAKEDVKSIGMKPDKDGAAFYFDCVNNRKNIAAARVACGEYFSESEMFVSHNNQGQSNSLLKPALHLEQHPDVVFTDTEKITVIPMDSLPFAKEMMECNILVMDTQGFEGQVLKGASIILKKIDLIYTECNRGQTYAGNMEIEEMDELLKKQGFDRVETYWPSPNWTWGDCAYLRNPNF